MREWTGASHPLDRTLGAASEDRMEFRRILALRGPNRWSSHAALEIWIAGARPDVGPALIAAVPAAFPAGRTTDEAAALARLAVELQRRAGVNVANAQIQAHPEPGWVRAIVPFEEEAVGRAAVEAAQRLINAALAGPTIGLDDAVQALRDLSHEVCLGPSTRAIVEAARKRGIPASRMNDGSLVQLGLGRAQRRIWTAETDQTGVIAEAIAQDKDLTKIFLRSVGVPVPWGRPVTSPEDAWEAALQVGGPVVVKPRDGNQGRGVATNLSTRDQVIRAYQAARAESEEVLVEQYAPGDDYRLLVIGGRMVAAARREPAQVIGDGHSTIARLVEIANQDPRRSDDHATALSKIYLDDIALAVLAEQGHAPDSIPAPGERVLIRRNANLSTGGTAVDVTDQVHPDVARRAVDAARAVGLDIAGIDIVARDISRPLEEQAAMIVEVNAGPGLRMHLEPSAGTPRPVGEAVVDALFPPGANGRIPVVAVTGTNGKTTTTRLIAHILANDGQTTVGMTCTDGIFLGPRCIESDDCSGPRSARAVLGNPLVEAAVLETARGGILREGLGFDRCDVAVITNIGQGDHLGMGGVHTVEELARVKRTIVDHLAPEGAAVLNAADPLTAAMAPHSPGKVLFFGRDETIPALTRHLAAGGRAVLALGDSIVLAEGSRRRSLMPLSAVPLTHGGRVAFQVENALAATAACWALDIDPDQIRRGLSTFAGNASQAPGRFNVLQGRGITILVDYGHNPSALEALAAALDAFPSARRLAVFSAAGDRRDVDITKQGELLGRMVDHLILYEEQEWRYDRPIGQIAALLRQGAASTPSRRAARIEEVPDERTGVAVALEHLRPGDLLLIQASCIGATLGTVSAFLGLLDAPDGVDRQQEPAAAGA
jgi:cyanophycin synthetase